VATLGARTKLLLYAFDDLLALLVAGQLRNAGHECWTAAEANLAGRVAADDGLSVYAQDKQVVVVTHDREFSQRRLRNTFGKHVWLRCEQPDADALVAENLDELVNALTSIPT
jgi:predicted nuclease of predicted toxin-antitoxin system